MVATLVEAGRLTPGWRPMFERVARHLFIPDTIWRLDRAARGRRDRPDHRRPGTDGAGPGRFGKVTVHTGDGADGDPDGGRYDRVSVTVGATTVPYSWIAQTVPGGRVVVPLTNTYQPPGIVTLTVHGDGTASGRIGGPAAFMALRAQRAAPDPTWTSSASPSTPVIPSCTPGGWSGTLMPRPLSGSTR